MTVHPADDPEDLDRLWQRIGVAPGDTIVLRAGRWHRRDDGKPPGGELHDLHGTEEDPIVVQAAGAVSGGRSASPLDGREADWLLRLSGCEHVVVRGLEVSDFWPAILILNECKNVRVEGCHFRHGTNAIIAKECTDVVVAKSSWVQDDTPRHYLWSRADWEDAHGRNDNTGTRRYYNGAMFWARNCSRVTIADNEIHDAYNGIRMKVDVASSGSDPQGNRDVVIERNRFLRIRDNPIEPERFAFNWHIRHNVIVDAHAWFSLDGVAGGFWYIYGNTGTFRSRQGGGNLEQHGVGRVLKLSFETYDPAEAYGRVVPTFPWYVVHNSFHLQCPLIGGSAPSLELAGDDLMGPDITAGLVCRNNVFSWAVGSDDGLSRPLALIQSFRKRAADGVEFDGNITNRADYIAHARETGLGEAGGIYHPEPLFRDVAADDFQIADALVEAGHAEAPALRLADPSGRVWRIKAGAEGHVLRGARQGDGLALLEEMPAEQA